jgi:hypothetical protein
MAGLFHFRAMCLELFSSDLMIVKFFRLVSAHLRRYAARARPSFSLLFVPPEFFVFISKILSTCGKRQCEQENN